MMSDPDAHDLPPGASQYQDNIQSLSPGKLTGRRGYSLLQFSQGSGTSGSPVISMYTYTTGIGSWITYHTTDNKIRAGLI